MKTINVRIEGTRPLLMHNGALADKLNPWVKRMQPLLRKTAKKRTDDDEEKIAEYEWNGGLWYDDVAERPVIPAEAIEGTIRDGARASRQGVDAICGVTVDCGSAMLIYSGPTKRDALWSAVDGGRKRFVDRRGAGVQKSRVMRTRPRFDEWASEFTINVDTDAIDAKAVHRALIESGARKGIGDFRPRFGLFTVTKFEEVKK